MVAAIAACGGDGDNTGMGPPPFADFAVEAGGNNVPSRYSSDLWVHGAYAYTGTWGGVPRGGVPGNVLNVWSLDAAGAPTLVDSVRVPGVTTVSDVQVSDDGAVVVFSAEGSTGAGIHVYDLSDPRMPSPRGSVPVATGIHTATIADLAGRRYVFAAQDPPGPALLILDITDPDAIPTVATVPIPADYGIHDTYVRDGLAFVFAWNSGVIIYDVGNGIRGGSPSSPAEVGRLVTSDRGMRDGPSVHNGWWFHNPVQNERRYLFIGQEGAGSITGARSSGDIHVVDVSDPAQPREVAFFHLDGAGTHNFWMDESRQILYAAYYNAGVVALDVSGTLAGDLSNRLIARIAPGGAGNTFTWGVQLSGGSLYAIDMLSGLWQLRTP
ncbi:MAG: hypothetical protein ABI860_09430 [Gemmatimonadales bacterium]